MSTAPSKSSVAVGAIDPQRKAEIRARVEAATPGPWRWRGNVDHDDPRLMAPRRDVLGHVPRERTMEDREAKSYADFLRDIQVRADDGTWRHLTDDEVTERVRDEWLTDQWGEVRRDERLGFVNENLIYEYARDLAVFEVCPEATSRNDPRIYRADIIGIRHPDAEFIAHAREDVEALLNDVEFLEAEAKRAWHQVGLQADVKARALRAIDAVVRVHLNTDPSGNCEHCDRAWPCPTIKALSDVMDPKKPSASDGAA